MTEAMPFSEADRREYLVRDGQLQRLEMLVEHIHRNAVNVKVGLSIDWESLPTEDHEYNPLFKLTTETALPVMVQGENAGEFMKSDYTFDEAEAFLGGLTFGLMFGGNWSE